VRVSRDQQHYCGAYNGDRRRRERGCVSGALDAGIRGECGGGFEGGWEAYLMLFDLILGLGCRVFTSGASQLFLFWGRLWLWNVRSFVTQFWTGVRYTTIIMTAHFYNIPVAISLVPS
jgi:hypothetical protein